MDTEGLRAVLQSIATTLTTAAGAVRAASEDEETQRNVVQVRTKISNNNTFDHTVRPV